MMTDPMRVMRYIINVRLEFRNGVRELLAVFDLEALEFMEEFARFRPVFGVDFRHGSLHGFELRDGLIERSQIESIVPDYDDVRPWRIWEPELLPGCNCLRWPCFGRGWR